MLPKLQLSDDCDSLISSHSVSALAKQYGKIKHDARELRENNFLAPKQHHYRTIAKTLAELFPETRKLINGMYNQLGSKTRRRYWNQARNETIETKFKLKGETQTHSAGISNKQNKLPMLPNKNHQTNGRKLHQWKTSPLRSNQLDQPRKEKMQQHHLSSQFEQESHQQGILLNNLATFTSSDTTKCLRPML